ncbi:MULTISPECIES: SHOCT domain-containing protein [unclassified Microbacterium]|uniref:SHOCT domain-containing protein n=1 Tax=unclassified Microbacterium TaxID=2609290 RepID=UPI00214BCE66|nr:MULTISPECIES: SHOCT domain-containing protein [unclassified Microbacterium]MCR2808591.1 SHOCT domain-containing protein [Microbacterium sp. zg.B185]WIM18971.1 SHOCT domain-containing protein [Microbacterium sp. zg-B185]
MPIRRMGRPGLLGMAARTAVVAGTATAVSGSVQRHQQERAQNEQYQQDAQAAAQQAQLDEAARRAAQQARSAPVPAGGGGDLVGELQKLAALKDAGILTDQEFTTAKAKLLG